MIDKLMTNNITAAGAVDREFVHIFSDFFDFLVQHWSKNANQG